MLGIKHRLKGLSHVGQEMEEAGTKKDSSSKATSQADKEETPLSLAVGELVRNGAEEGRGHEKAHQSDYFGG